MGMEMVGSLSAWRQGKMGAALKRVVTGSALAVFLALPAGAQPGINSPAISANKIVVPQSAGAKLVADRSSYLPGQPVALAFTVTNPTKKPVRFDFDSGQQADFTVADSKGNVVWDSTQYKVSFHGITHLTLSPGKSHVYHAAWNQRDLKARPLAPGAYTVTARLNSMPRMEVSGGLIVNTDRDPANLGMPMKGPAETGETIQQNVTPSVSASTQITIEHHR